MATEFSSEPRARLRRSWKSITLVHITASVGLLGATSSSLVLAITAATTDHAAFAHSAYRLVSTQSAVFGIPLSFLALGSGIALGLGTRWGVLRYRWTTAKLALIVLVIVNGALEIGPTTSARLRGDGSEWWLVAVLAASAAMLASAAVLSVYKPGGRLRSRAARARARSGP
jgi:hypothetical protein